MSSEESAGTTQDPEKELLQIKEALELKDELLLHITRELRSSLSVIREPIKELEQQVSDENPELIHTIEGMKEKQLRLAQIIQQLEDVSQLRAYHSDLKVAEVELCSQLRRYMAFFESKAQQKNISLQTGLPEHEIIQTLDPEKFEKIILILVSNAIKFTPEDGRVNVQLTELEESVEISIADTGPGIPEDKLNELFFASPSAEEETDTDRQNLGVRLSIIQKYVELHEGTITVESEEGEGTEFTLSLPKQAQSVEHAKSREVAIETDILQREYAGYERPLQHAKKDQEETILIVEDNPEMQDYMVSLLDVDGLHIDVASNGVEALKQLSLTEPDLIISDIMMPEMDGFELVKNIRSNPQYYFTPVILISAKAEEEARLEGYRIGISDYLVKPFSEAELKVRIQNLLRQKRERLKYISETQSQGTADDKTSLVETLKQYIESRITNETITIKELSQGVNMSRRQLYRDLKALTGFTPAEFVREVKLRRARNLLEQNPKITVSEVARQVGYRTVGQRILVKLILFYCCSI